MLSSSPHFCAQECDVIGNQHHYKYKKLLRSGYIGVGWSLIQSDLYVYKRHIFEYRQIYRTLSCKCEDGTKKPGREVWNRSFSQSPQKEWILILGFQTFFFHMVFGIEPRALCILCKYSIISYIPRTDFKLLTSRDVR
jgi:hypothetical protein